MRLERTHMHGERFQTKFETEIARELRQREIDAERKLWFHLRQGNKTGPKIRRQHPLYSFIVDFYCHAARLVLEIDGTSHENEERVAKDVARDAYLAVHGIEVIRMKPAVADDGIVEFVAWFRDQCHERSIMIAEHLKPES